MLSMCLCFFTLNKSIYFSKSGDFSIRNFAADDLDELWTTFLCWLAALSFVRRWTATVERSLKSKDPGRLHLHAFHADFWRLRHVTTGFSLVDAFDAPLRIASFSPKSVY